MQAKEHMSSVSREALKGQQWIQPVANGVRVPACLRKGLWCASVGEGPHGAKERGTQGQRLLASPAAAPVGSS